MHHASFSDMPNELILQILEQKEINLSQVALISRHLNQLATYVFLSSKGLASTNLSHLNLTLHLKLNLTTELVKACSLDTLLSW